jgi:hypothetical protein
MFDRTMLTHVHCLFLEGVTFGEVGLPSVVLVVVVVLFQGIDHCRSFSFS